MDSKKQPQEIDPVRRKLLRTTAVLGGVFAAGQLPYEKPALKSFLGVREAWAQGTGPSMLSCTADVVPSPGPGQACQNSVLQNLMVQVSPIPPVGTVINCTPTTTDPANSNLPNTSSTAAATDAAGKATFADFNLMGNVPAPPLALGSVLTLTATFNDPTTFGNASCINQYTIVACP